MSYVLGQWEDILAPIISTGVSTAIQSGSSIINAQGQQQVAAQKAAQDAANQRLLIYGGIGVAVLGIGAAVVLAKRKK